MYFSVNTTGHMVTTILYLLFIWSEFNNKIHGKRGLYPAHLEFDSAVSKPKLHIIKQNAIKTKETSYFNP